MAIITPYKAQQQHIEKKLPTGFSEKSTCTLQWTNMAIAGKSPIFSNWRFWSSFLHANFWSVFTTQSSENKHLEAFCYGFYPNFLWFLCAFRAADWHSPCVNFRTIRRLRELPGNLGKNASETSVGTVFSMHLGPCEKLVLGLVKTLILLQIHWYSWGVTSVWGVWHPRRSHRFIGIVAWWKCFVFRGLESSNWYHQRPRWPHVE